MKDWRGLNIDEEPSRDVDLEALRKLLEVHELTNAGEVTAFESMRHSLENGREMLSERQRAWVMEALSRFEVAGYENLVSRGLVSAETKVATLPCLRPEALPKRPPPRRRDE